MNGLQNDSPVDGSEDDEAENTRSTSRPFDWRPRSRSNEDPAKELADRLRQYQMRRYGGDSRTITRVEENVSQRTLPVGGRETVYNRSVSSVESGEPSVNPDRDLGLSNVGQTRSTHTSRTSHTRTVITSGSNRQVHSGTRHGHGSQTWSSEVSRETHGRHAGGSLSSGSNDERTAEEKEEEFRRREDELRRRELELLSRVSQGSSSRTSTNGRTEFRHSSHTASSSSSSASSSGRDEELRRREEFLRRREEELRQRTYQQRGGSDTDSRTHHRETWSTRTGDNERTDSPSSRRTYTETRTWSSGGSGSSHTDDHSASGTYGSNSGRDIDSSQRSVGGGHSSSRTTYDTTRLSGSERTHHGGGTGTEDRRYESRTWSSGGRSDGYDSTRYGGTPAPSGRDTSSHRQWPSSTTMSWRELYERYKTSTTEAPVTTTEWSFGNRNISTYDGKSISRINRTSTTIHVTGGTHGSTYNRTVTRFYNESTHGGARGGSSYGGTTHTTSGQTISRHGEGDQTESGFKVIDRDYGESSYDEYDDEDFGKDDLDYQVPVEDRIHPLAAKHGKVINGIELTN